MKKLIVLAFVMALAACGSKNKAAPAAPKADDAKMEPAPAADGDKKPEGDAKPAEGDAAKDPCAAPK
jgi:hypothetical protein